MLNLEGGKKMCVLYRKSNDLLSGFTQCSLKYCTEERMQSVGSTFLRNFVGRGGNFGGSGETYRATWCKNPKDKHHSVNTSCLSPRI